MILDDIERLLRETIGLHVETVGLSVIAYALKQRMAATRSSEPAVYWQLVSGSREELQQLVNAVVIPETWFFRDREAFVAMARHARTNRRQGQPLRLVSLPCSTGEEPFSMAMAMFDAGFQAGDFVIDAIDVSSRNIAEAERAIYGRNSFRGADLAFRARYFEPAEGGYRPLDAVRRQVRFKVGNLFDPAATAGPDAYDIAFCRNLLIYFDRAQQERALGRLRQILVPNGLLLVGPAESSLPTLWGFVSARQPMAFAFSRVEAPIRMPDAPPAPPPRPKRVAPPAPAARLARPAPAAPAAPAAPEEAARLSLADVERAANAGRLAEARTAAARHIERFGPSPQIHYLLGLAHDADDAEAAAIENYRKALYLEPDHREALAHLALLLQRRGDAAGAQVLSNRLGRINQRSERR